VILVNYKKADKQFERGPKNDSLEARQNDGNKKRINRDNIKLLV
jgi:hypothetical protein